MALSRARWTVLLTVAACSLPSRDNPHDPAVSPVASLYAVDAGDQGPCLSAQALGSSLSSFAPTLTIARTRCMALVARDSRDPQGDALEFRFRRLETDQAIDLEGGDWSLADLFVLSSAALLALPQEQILTFEVAARDPAGSTEVATTQVSISNAPPVAIGDPPRTVPVGGHAWSPGASYTITFDASPSYDPDRTELAEYCWKFPASATNDACSSTDWICRETPDDPCFTRTIAADDRHRVVAHLRVGDGLATSSVEQATVAVTDPNLWGENWSLTINGETVGQPTRYDAQLRKPDIPGAVPGINVAAEYRGAGGPPRVAVLYREEFGATNLRLSDGWPVLTFDDGIVVQPTLGTGKVGIVVDAVRQRIWTGALGTYPSPTYQAFAFTGSALELVASGTYGSPGYYVEGRLLSAVDGEGNAWFAPFGEQMVVLDAPVTGSPGEPFTFVPGIPYSLPDRVVTGLASRPGSGEVWSVYSSSPFTGIESDATLVRHTGIGPADAIPFPLGDTHALGLAWVDSDRLWLSLGDRGLVLVNATCLASGGCDLDQAIEVEIPDAVDAVHLVADPWSGTCWAAGLWEEDGLRAEIDGTLVAFSGFEFEVQFVDPDGALWFYADDRLVRASMPDSSRVLARVPLTPVHAVSVDADTGGVWIPTRGPSTLNRVAEDGRVVVSMPVERMGNALGPLSLFQRSPGGTDGWALALDPYGGTHKGIYHVDLSDPDGSTTTLHSFLGSFAVDGFFSPSAPLPQSTPFLWSATQTASTPPVVRAFTRTGPVGSGFALPSNIAAAAVSHRTNRLFIAARNGNTLEIRPTAVPAPAYSSPIVATFNLGTELALATVATSDDGSGGDLFWVVLTDNVGGSPPCSVHNFTSNVRVYRDDGTVFGYYQGEPGEITSIVPRGPDTYWITARRCVADGEFATLTVDLRQYEIRLGSPVRTGEAVGIGSDHLVSPESSPHFPIYPN